MNTVEAERFMTQQLDRMVERNGGRRIRADGCEWMTVAKPGDPAYKPQQPKKPKQLRDLPSLAKSRRNLLTLLKKRVDGRV